MRNVKILSSMHSKSINDIFKRAVDGHINGNLDAAVELYGDVLRLEPNHTPSLNNLGAIYLQAGHMDSAIRFFKKPLN